jgi:hypothetical protein
MPPRSTQEKAASNEVTTQGKKEKQEEISGGN